MQAIARGSWKPHPTRPDDGRHSFLAVVAEEEGLHCIMGDPHEADPSKPPREVGPASGPREVGHATLGEGHGLPIVLHLFLRLGRSPDRYARGVDRHSLLARP